MEALLSRLRDEGLVVDYLMMEDGSAVVLWDDEATLIHYKDEADLTARTGRKNELRDLNYWKHTGWERAEQAREAGHTEDVLAWGKIWLIALAMQNDDELTDVHLREAALADYEAVIVGMYS